MTEDVQKCAQRKWPTSQDMVIKFPAMEDGKKETTFARRWIWPIFICSSAALDCAIPENPLVVIPRYREWKTISKEGPREGIVIHELGSIVL